MGNNRRLFVPGGTYFFTLVTAERSPWLGTADGRSALGAAMRAVRVDQPFSTLGIVVLPDHLHCIWTLPEGDTDFPGRWKRIKQRCSSRLRRAGFGSGPYWQRRYWEHLLRDERDLARHLDYIHYNPVRHGLAAAPAQWPASSFRRCVAMGWYERGWAGPEEDVEVVE